MTLNLNYLKTLYTEAAVLGKACIFAAAAIIPGQIYAQTAKKPNIL